MRSNLRPRAALAVVLLCACAHAGSPAPAAEPAPDPTDAARTAITAANEEFARALVRGDAAAMAALFTEDGEIVPSTQRGVVSGRAAIEAYQSKRLEGRRYLEVVITTSELEVQGDLAWEIGTNRVTIQQARGAPVVVTGRYLAVWKRGPDGTWRIRADLPVTDPVQ